MDIFDFVGVIKCILDTISEKRNVKKIVKRNMPRTGRENDTKDKKKKQGE